MDNMESAMSNQFEMPWVKMLSPEFVSMSEGELTLALCPTETHMNHNGDINAGPLFSLSEMAGMGVVVGMLGKRVKDAFVVCKNVSIDFVARAQGKISFVATITPEQVRTIFQAVESGNGINEIVRVVGKNEEGKICTQAQVVCVIKPART
jgi:acyl-coenzyme A thioesterase PaaI-like protein